MTTMMAAMGSHDGGFCYCIAIVIVMISIPIIDGDLAIQGKTERGRRENVWGNRNFNSKCRALRPVERVIYLQISEM